MWITIRNTMLHQAGKEKRSDRISLRIVVWGGSNSFPIGGGCDEGGRRKLNRMGWCPRMPGKTHFQAHGRCGGGPAILPLCGGQYGNYRRHLDEAYRFSMAWSRILPAGDTGPVNERGGLRFL